MTDANETAKEEAIKIPDVLPVLPLKDLVIFPFIIVPLSVSREKSINAVDQALAENRVIMLTAQKDFQNEDPGEEDLYRVGTVAIIMRMLKLPDGRIRILVQGLSRARIDYFIQTAPFFKAKITRIEEPVTKDAVAGGRSADPRRQAEPRPRRLPRQEHLPRGDGDRRQPGRSGAADRSRRVATSTSSSKRRRAILETIDPRRAPEEGQRAADARDQPAHHAAGDLLGRRRAR